jgi:chorismate mutase
MAEKVKFIIDIDDKGSAKVVDKLADGLNDVKKAGGKAADGIQETTQAAEKGEGAFKKLGSTIKGGLGIGLVIGALDALKNGLMENQKVQDLMNQAMVVFQGVINGVIEVLDPLFKALMLAFQSPKQAWDDLMASFEMGANWIKENLIDFVFNKFIEWANDAQIGILKLRKAWNEWTKDTEEAKKIQEEINALQDENNKLNEENAKKVQNIQKVVSSVKEGVVSAFNTIAKSTKKAFDNKDVLANAEFNINKLAALYTGIVEKYDLMSEKQRQIRDDETKTISERIAANEELAKILDEGAEKEKSNIQARIGLLQMQQSMLGVTKDRQLEILSLQQELTGVDAKYAGLKSEQLTNINSLEKEGIELKRAEAEGTIEANAIIAQSNADLLAETLEGFDARKKAIDEEYKSRSELLASEISQLKEGTQAYVDAINEKKVLDAQYIADVKSNETDLLNFQKEINQQKKDDDKAVAEAKVDALMVGIQGVQDLIGADSKYGKALAIAQAVINTYQGASKAIAQGGVFGPIAAAGAIASGLAQVRSIMQTELPESPMGGGGGGGTPSVAMPSVGIVSGQMNQTNQLQAQLNSQMSRPTRAYVVGQNVTSQQSLDRHIAQNATL